MAKQDGRYSEQELAIIKATFNNDELLRALHKVFLQLPLNALNLSSLQLTLKDKKDIHKIIRKMFLPQLTDDVPYQHAVDITAVIDFKNKAYEEIVLHIQSSQLYIKYIDQQLKLIEKGKYQTKNPKINFKRLTESRGEDGTQLFINTLTRNNIVNTVSGRLMNLELLAKPEETLEQRNERLQKDSTK